MDTSQNFLNAHYSKHPALTVCKLVHNCKANTGQKSTPKRVNSQLDITGGLLRVQWREVVGDLLQKEGTRSFEKVT